MSAQAWPARAFAPQDERDVVAFSFDQLTRDVLGSAMGEPVHWK
jgi:hypothetical protein